MSPYEREKEDGEKTKILNFIFYRYNKELKEMALGEDLHAMAVSKIYKWIIQ